MKELMLLLLLGVVGSGPRADAHFGRHAEAEQFALGVEFC